MTDLELAQQALPNPDSGVEIVGLGNFNANAIWTTYSGGSMLKMFLSGMAKAREIDAQQQAPTHDEIECLLKEARTLRDALWKACGDDEEIVNSYIDSVS
jgi:hypothetical protein